MNGRIIRTLIGKEASRLAAQRSALALAGLLVAAALLLRTYGKESAVSQPIHTCWIDYWEDSAWLEHLRTQVPYELRNQIRFRSVNDIPTDSLGTLQYGHGEAAIQIRQLPPNGVRPRFKIWIWHPGHDPHVLAPVESWFWRETTQFGEPSPAEVEIERSTLRGLNLPSVAAVALTLFSIFFVCVCVMPAITCEEKDRGTFSAQSLTPASAGAAVVAKALVFAPAAFALALVLTAIVHPARLAEPQLWSAFVVAVAAAFGLGLTVAAIARTQRAAGTGALCYALAAAIVVALSRRLGADYLADLMLEARIPAALTAAISRDAGLEQWRSLGFTALLASGWIATGALLFARSWRWSGFSIVTSYRP